MPRLLLLALVLAPFAARAADDAPDLADADWPWWRGPSRDGVAKQSPPTKWSGEHNVLWRADVPGKGHGSPIVVGHRVFLATADEKEQTQYLLCFHKDTGKPLWKTPVHKGKFVTGGNGKSSHASSTPACDGKRVFVNFPIDAAVHASALDLDGKILWQAKVTDYVLHQGFGSSPTVYGSLALFAADNKGGGRVVGLDRATGKLVWKHDRPRQPNYASPIVLRADGKDQLVLTGCDKVASFDPLTGKQNWEMPGSTTECVTSAVTDGTRVFTSGGYPKNHISAVRADGSGKVEWQDGTRVYVPSMVVRDKHLYAVLDAGTAVCRRCDTGETVWKGPLKGNFSSSLVLAGDNLFATNEAGLTFVFAATPDGLKVVERNQLGSEVMATPAVCGGRLYHRVAERIDGRRQEALYCIGTK